MPRQDQTLTLKLTAGSARHQVGPAAADLPTRRDLNDDVCLLSTAHVAAPRAATYLVRVRGHAGGTGPYAPYVQRMGNFAPAAPVFP